MRGPSYHGSTRSISWLLMPWLIKMLSYQYKDIHQDKTVSRNSWLYHGNLQTRKDRLYIETGPWLHWKSTMSYHQVLLAINSRYSIINDCQISVKIHWLTKWLKVRGPSYHGSTRSILWLMMPWLLTSRAHQQPWYSLCRIGRYWSYLRNDFNYLCLINVQKWQKM